MKLAMVFPGQGSQKQGMMQGFAESAVVPAGRSEQRLPCRPWNPVHSSYFANMALLLHMFYYRSNGRISNILETGMSPVNGDYRKSVR